MIWTITAGITAFILAWGGITYSERIKTDEGDLYHFPTRVKWLTALLSAGMTVRLTHNVPSRVEWLLFISIGVLLSMQFVIDFKYKELANEWNVALAISSLFLVLFQGKELFQTRLMAWGILTVFFFGWWVFSTGLGFGDVKLIAATSFLLTGSQVMPYLVLVLSLAILFGLSVMVIQRKGLKTEFAFGPFLILGILLVGIG